MKRTLFIVLVPFLADCVMSSHAVRPSTLGQSRSSDDLIAAIDAPGPITVETVVSADWEVDLGGMLNLKHPKAVAAGLKEHPEPIQVYFHVLRHPNHGTFLVDTGFESALRDVPERAAIRGLITYFMKRERIKFHTTIRDWMAAHREPIAGVFLTHLHLDHVGGLPDVPSVVPVYAGPGEASQRALLFMFVQGSTDRALDGKQAIQEWTFRPNNSGHFAGVIDVFGDGSLWAIWVPGHTTGSTAYLARTPTGPVLLVGDCSHTRWGWEHDVEPGTFSRDPAAARDSFVRLRRLATDHPSMQVRLGHQL